VSHKQDLLKRAAEEYRSFHQAIDGLNEEQLTEPCLGTWSVREIVGHMVGWHREMAPALDRMARGERPIPPGVSYEDVDAWNAKFAGAVRGKRVTDVLLEFDASHEDFITAADRVPEERFEPGKTAHRIVDMNSAHHYKEHGDEIRVWRASRGF
jgi:uncharacterized protein (TIGR03083 family)